MDRHDGAIIQLASPERRYENVHYDFLNNSFLSAEEQITPAEHIAEWESMRKYKFYFFVDVFLINFSHIHNTETII